MSLPSAASLEAVSLRAWPAVEEAWQGGWLLRASGGYTRRANSVQPIGEPGDALPAAIGRAAAWYRARTLRPVFKLTDIAVPATLDEALAEAGWLIEVPTLVMTRPPAAAPEPPPLPAGHALSLDGDAGADWADAYSRWHGLPADAAARHLAIVGRIRPPRAAARLRDGHGRLVAIGLAVADGPWTGLFDLVTDPERRGRGLGRALVGRLLAWGAARGAAAAYLQVEERNRGARRMYGHLGFAEAYRYWYRVAPDRPPPGAG